MALQSAVPKRPGDVSLDAASLRLYTFFLSTFIPGRDQVSQAANPVGILKRRDITPKGMKLALEE